MLELGLEAQVSQEVTAAEVVERVWRTTKARGTSGTNGIVPAAWGYLRIIAVSATSRIVEVR